MFVCVCSVLVPGINGHPAEAGPEMYVCVCVCVCVCGWVWPPPVPDIHRHPAVACPEMYLS